jgi:hypothetical protein
MADKGESKMLKGLSVSSEMKQGRYFNINRLINSFNKIDEYIDGQESKGGSQDAVLQWLKGQSDEQTDVSKAVVSMSKVLESVVDRLNKDGK